MNSHKALLDEVFGESSSSETEEEEEEFPKPPRVLWEQIKNIKGLWLCKDFLSPQQQSSLLSAIHNEGWFAEVSHNQAMKFGDLPSWAIELSDAVREGVIVGDYDSEYTDVPTCTVDKETCVLPLDLLSRDPLFDQLIVNVYQPGEGICAHVDLMRFADGIAIVSLESPCVMHFTQVGEASNNEKAMDNGLCTQKVPVFLTPGSLVLMSGEARYLWKHEINRKPGIQMWKGWEIYQKRRTSITLRKLCQTE